MNRRALFTSLAGRRPPDGRNDPSYARKRFTNALLRTHHGKEVRFYDDLIKGKQVVMNLMYANCEGVCPAITANLHKVYKALEHRMGKDLFMYSITLKPEQDDPSALMHFAEMHGVANLPGWLFLTGDPYDIETIRFRLFRWDHIKFDLDLDTHTSMLRIINEATHQWTMVQPMVSVYTIVQHISWCDPPKTLEERLEENRKLQEKIDEDRRLHGYRKNT
ncbi:MAG TPA: SCO family protein [Blastocatellia bacterium]|nr:SCO family protein [Blastocatellia bacterium]